MMVSTEEDDPNTVTEFNIFGLTVLGKDVNGSCPSACMSITRFSVEEAIEAFHNKEVIKMQENEVVMEEQTESFEEAELACKTKCADGEEDMECKKCSDDQADMACKTQCADGEEDMECKKCSETEADMGCKTKCADSSEDMECKKCAESEAEMADCGCGGKNDEEDMQCKKCSETEMADLRAKCEELAAQIENNNNVIMEQERELAELRAFKEQAQMAELAANVDAVLSEVSTTFGEDQLAEYRQEAMSGGHAYFDAWSNKVKAAAFSAIKDNKKVAMSETLWGGMMVMAAPINNTKISHGLWD